MLRSYCVMSLSKKGKDIGRRDKNHKTMGDINKIYILQDFFSPMKIISNKNEHTSDR